MSKISKEMVSNDTSNRNLHFNAEIEASEDRASRLTEKSDRAACAGKDTEGTFVVGLYTVLNSTDEQTSACANSARGHTISKGRAFREGLGDYLLVGLVGGHDDRSPSIWCVRPVISVCSDRVGSSPCKCVLSQDARLSGSLCVLDREALM